MHTFHRLTQSVWYTVPENAYTTSLFLIWS